MSTTELDRSMLEAKDRDELHAIAGAVGVKAPTRMRKADLVTAILAATSGDADASGDSAVEEAPDGGGGRPRTVRSARASGAGAIEALAAEEDAIAAPGEPEQEIAPRPRRTPRPAAGATGTADLPAREREVVPTPAAAGGGEGPEVVPFESDDDDDRNLIGDGGSRRRRRGRGRGRPGEGEMRPGLEPAGEPVEVRGLLELRDEGYGFLRTTGFLAGPSDVYVSASQVRRFALRKGDVVEGASRPQASNEK
ncbi:MAG: Rho termination factor N-terminal domain-containing protein, partial [Actinomycetota bacterium]